MSATSAPRPRAPRSRPAPAGREDPPVAAPKPPSDVPDEIAALLRLAEIDAALLAREAAGQAPVHDEVADERHGLGARLRSDILEAYERALRGGRAPAVVRLESSVCSGCHVRLHATLVHRIRRLSGIGSCPRCLRLVYDPEWRGR